MSAFSDFMSRLPKGSNVVITVGSFSYDGQILNYDTDHLIISDGKSIQLLRIGAIDEIDYCLPDTPLEIAEVRR